jgi:CubicO group peptidase (beta-lactamase class C family)
MQNSRLVVSKIVLSTTILFASICCTVANAQDALKQEPLKQDSPKQDAPEAIWPTKQWQTSTPEDQGMASAALAGLVEFGTGYNLDSLLIVRHGKIVLDAYYAPYAADIPHAVNSVTKSVIGTLTAIALKEGSLDSVDHPVMDFFADRGIANTDDRKKAITLQHLLDMTSGIDWREPVDGRPETMIEMERSPDWVKFILDRPMSNTPGEIFNYNSGNPHLLSAILTKVTGMSTSDYAKAKLFGPLGISTWHWRQDPQGLPIGGYGLFLQPHDMAKIGYLYLRHGEWEGKALIPPAWVDKVSHATVNMNAPYFPALRYSNLFWSVPERQFYSAVGYHSQFIMVFPALDIVAVTTARDFFRLGKLALLISRAVKSETAMPSDAAGANLLAGALHEISTEKPAAVGATPEIASTISGKTYQFRRNTLNLKSLSLAITDPNPHYDLELYDKDPAQPPHRLTGPFGLDGLYRKSGPTESGVIAARGSWLNSHTFVTELLTVGAGRAPETWTLWFDGETVNVRGKDRNGRDVTLEGRLGG